MRRNPNGTPIREVDAPTWEAIAEPKDDAWHAVLQVKTGEQMVPHATCSHRHKSKAAAQKCARGLAEQEGVLTL